MYSIYRVLNGDTLESIANKNNTTVDDLKKINNNLNLNNGYIIVPYNEDSIFETYIVKKGDNLYDLSKKYNIDVSSLSSLNGIGENDYIYPNQELVVPSFSYTLYVTKNSDTLKDIKDKLNTNYDTLFNQNSKIYLLPDQLIILKKNL